MANWLSPRRMKCPQPTLTQAAMDRPGGTVASCVTSMIIVTLSESNRVVEDGCVTFSVSSLTWSTTLLRMAMMCLLLMLLSSLLLPIEIDHVLNSYSKIYWTTRGHTTGKTYNKNIKLNCALWPFYYFEKNVMATFNQLTINFVPRNSWPEIVNI